MRLLPRNPAIRFYLALLGLFLNLVGAVLLFFAFSFSSSAISIDMMPSGAAYLSVNGQSGIAIGGKQTAFAVVIPRSMPSDKSAPLSRLALLNSSHPAFAWTGLILIIISFIPSILSLEYPEQNHAESQTSLVAPVEFP